MPRLRSPSRVTRLVQQLQQQDRSLHAMTWIAASGLCFGLGNAVLRTMALRVGTYQVMAMQYGLTLLLIFPVAFAVGMRACLPSKPKVLLLRGAVHWVATIIWLTALAQITLAEATAISFTGPLFVIAGGSLLLKERFRWDRVLAALAGLAGVLVIVAARLSGSGGAYSLLMLLAILIYSGAYLMTKHLTSVEPPWRIVLWQSAVVGVCSVGAASFQWQAPSMQLWAIAASAAALTLGGQYCLAKAFSVADVSASQAARYLDLVWACLFGWMFFGDRVQLSTMAGISIIVAATAWLARREATRT